jgi:hypothetical protein
MSYKGLLTAILPTGAMTGTATIHSQVIDATQFEGIAFQPQWTGTPTGTFIVEVSLDYVPNLASGGTPRNPGTWDNLGVSFPSNPAGTSSHCYCPVYASCTGYIRLTYTNASGSGVLSGMVIGKTRG